MTTDWNYTTINAMTELPTGASEEVYLPSDSDDRLIGRIALVTANMIGLFVAIGMTFLAPTDLSAPYMALAAVLGIGSCVLQVVYRMTGPKPRNWISADILFMIPFAIVHYVISIYWIFDLMRFDESIWWNRAVVCYSEMMSTAGLLAFAVGFNLLAEHKPNPLPPRVFAPESLEQLMIISKAVLILGWIVWVIILLFNRSTLLESSYSGFQQVGYLTNVLLVLCVHLLPLGIIPLTVAAGWLTGRWQIGGFIKALLLIFLVVNLALGFRSIAVSVVISAGIVYSTIVRPVSLKKAVIAGIVGFFLMGVSQLVRSLPERSIYGLMKGIQETQWDRGIINLGGSINTVYLAVNAVPSRFPYFLGAMKLQNITGIIPFSNKILPMESLFFVDSPNFITWLRYGNLKSGTGSTVVADLYVDFGLPGVMLGLFILGLISKKIQEKVRAGASVPWNLVYVLLMGSMITMCRGTYLSSLRTIVWLAVICWGMCNLAGVQGGRDDQLSIGDGGTGY